MSRWRQEQLWVWLTARRLPSDSEAARKMRWLLGNGWVMEPTASPLGPCEWQSSIKETNKQKKNSHAKQFTLFDVSPLWAPASFPSLLQFRRKLYSQMGPPSSTHDSTVMQIGLWEESHGTWDDWRTEVFTWTTGTVICNAECERRSHEERPDEASLRTPHSCCCGMIRKQLPPLPLRSLGKIWNINKKNKTSVWLDRRESHLPLCLLWRRGNKRKSHPAHIHPCVHFVMFSTGDGENHV